ncbi:MAG: hypothetical protein QM777_25005 [Pseudorhodoferax sp.]
MLTTRQRERITGAYAQCTPRDVEGFFAVLSKMVDADDLRWLTVSLRRRIEIPAAWNQRPRNDKAPACGALLNPWFARKIWSG